MRLALFIALLASCASPPRAAPSIVPVEVQQTERRAPGMMDAAMELIDANVGALIHLDRVREHRAAWNITRLGGFDKLCDDAGLDPVFDVDEVFIASPDLASCTETIVLRLPPDRVVSALAKLRARSSEPAAEVTGLGVPAIAVRTRERPQVFFAPRPDHLVMVPRDEISRAAAFLRATPLPRSKRGEAWSGWGTEKGWPLLGAFLPELVIPSAHVTTFLGPRHVTHARADATSPEAARNNAAILQKLTDRVLRMPIVGAMLLDPIDFRVEGSAVVTDVSLRPDEHEWLLAQMDDGCW